MILHYIVKLINTQGEGLRQLAGLLSQVPSQIAVLFSVGLRSEVAVLGTSIAQHCPVDLSALMKMLRICAGHSVATRHLLLFNTWNVAIATEEINFKMYFN